MDAVHMDPLGVHPQQEVSVVLPLLQNSWDKCKGKYCWQDDVRANPGPPCAQGGVPSIALLPGDALASAVLQIGKDEGVEWKRKCGGAEGTGQGAHHISLLHSLSSTPPTSFSNAGKGRGSSEGKWADRGSSPHQSVA